MPRIELIDVPLYNPNDPYFWEVDNIPLTALMRRQNLINMALDNVIQQMTDAIGTQGSISNRLSQSIDDDGSLKAEAIDQANHSIESHEDTADYVRMTAAQSDKLENIDELATSLYLQVCLSADCSEESDIIEIQHSALKFVPSDTITFTVGNEQDVSFHMAFPVDAAHQHFYNVIPIPVNQVTPDYQNYLVNSEATPFVEGTLRVYINGMRINTDIEVYAPGYEITDQWTLLKYTDTAAEGSFVLSNAVSATDVITVDYDISLAES